MNDNGWLDDIGDDDVTLMDKVKRKASTIRLLKQKMDAAEAAFMEAKKQYETSCMSMAEEFKLNGISTIVDDDGIAYAVVTKTTCNITKASKRAVADWLSGIGFTKIDNTFKVIGTTANEQLLKDAGIAYDKECDMNTNSVKAFLLGALGQKESPAIISKDDIPAGLNFYQYDTVEVKS